MYICAFVYDVLIVCFERLTSTSENHCLVVSMVGFGKLARKRRWNAFSKVLSQPRGSGPECLFGSVLKRSTRLLTSSGNIKMPWRNA
jgi:hypothetical protein